MNIRAAQCRRIVCLCLLALTLALIGVDTTAGAPVASRDAPSSADQADILRPTVSLPNMTVSNNDETPNNRALSRDNESTRAEPSASPSASPAETIVSTTTTMYEGDNHEPNGVVGGTYFMARAVSLASFFLLAGIGLLAARHRHNRHDQPPDE